MKAIWGVLMVGLLARPCAAEVVMTFDDGWASTSQVAMPIMNEAGIKGTAYIITGLLGTHNYLTWNEVLQLKENGWEIGNHTDTHPDLTKISLEEVISEVKISQHKFAEHDIFPTTFAPPFGDSTLIIREYLKRVFISSRGAWKTSTTDVFTIGEVDKYNLPVYGVYSPVNLKDIETKISLSVKEHKHLILMFHRIDEKPLTRYEITSKDFKEIVALCKKYNAKVGTLQDLINGR